MSVVDTSLIVHTTSALSVHNRRARQAIIRLDEASDISIPRPVIREYLSVLTGRGFDGRQIDLWEALDTVLSFTQRFKVLQDRPHVWAEFDIFARSAAFGGKQVHDANIVATMPARAETRLLTFNAKDFRRFVPLIEIILP